MPSGATSGRRAGRVLVPVEFLTDEQVRGYGRYAGLPSQAQLDRFFFLDERDQALIAQRRGEHNRLGFAVQLATVRFLGTFLADPLEVPWPVVEHLAAQLGIADPSCVKQYAARLPTQHEHAREIRQVYGYRDFGDPTVQAELRAWLGARAWTSAERPSVLFDRATAWLLERKVLLPGASVLARLVARERDQAATRLWRRLAGLVQREPGLQGRLAALLALEPPGRISRLERLRRAPARVSAKGLVDALDRVAELRGLGAGQVDVDAAGVPPGRLAVLARYAMGATPHTLARLASDRQAATLLAVARHLETTAVDDALDLVDVLLADLVARAERTSAHDQLKALPALGRAARRLATAVDVLLDPPEDARGLDNLWAAISQRVSRADLELARAAVAELAPDEDPDAAWRAALVDRYATARRFLPYLLEVICFQPAEGGREVLDALGVLPGLLARRKVTAGEVPLGVVRGAWQRLVLANPDLDLAAGEVDRRAYTVCVLEALHHALRRRDVYLPGSGRWADPRAALLDGPAWQAARPQVCESLRLDLDPLRHLGALGRQLDQAYREVASRLPTNAALRLDEQGRPHLAPLERLAEPASLLRLRERTSRMLPRIELPELLLEVDAWTGFTGAFTHASDAEARASDLATSVCAVLVASACNVGLVPVTNPAVPALRRGRLAWITHHYLRAETITAANARLVDHQSTIPLAQAWGGGQLASADGLRFVVPVRTVNAGPNPRYFGTGRGVTWLNYLSDQVTGFAAVVVPGTIRDSLYILDGLLEQETSLQPEQITTDTASYSDQVFGLFRLLGYQFSPRLADLSDQRFWRMDALADYGAFNGLARSRVNTRLIADNWEDLLRVAGSLATGAVRASEVLRVLQGGGVVGKW
jgi:TnpA family transposase